MTTLRFAFAECLWRLRWTVPAALLITAAAMYAWPDPPGAGAAAERTAVLWLHLPCFFTTAAALCAMVEVWPLFARGRPGADWVARLRPGRLGGCGAVSAGTLLALAACLLGVGAGFAGVLSALGMDLAPLHSQHRLLERPRFLDTEHPELAVDGPGEVMVAGILLRPRAILPPGTAFETTPVTITADGDGLHDGPIQLGGELEDFSLSFAPRRIGVLSIRRAEGRGAPLMFGTESIRAVAAARQSWILGCILGAFTYLFPAALALALACLLRQRLALPIVVVGVLAVLTASTILDLTPNGMAITALARERWFPGEETLGQIAAPAAAVAAVIALSVATGRPPR